MLVKKFEAPTMKEALALVKNQLGPDAIILAAKDNKKGFGLAGQSSVEVTAAISETHLKKKEIAEARLRDSDKAKVRSASAKTQKEFIDKSINRYLVKETEIKKGPLRYIDIDDGSGVANQVDTKSAITRVKNAAQSARQASAGLMENTQTQSARVTGDIPGNYKRVGTGVGTGNIPSQLPGMTFDESTTKKYNEIDGLKTEIQQLKSMLQNLKTDNVNPNQLHPGAEHGLPYDLSSTFKKLLDSGISEKWTVALLKAAHSQLSSEQMKRSSFVEAWIAKVILGDIKLAELLRPGLHLFVGASGHGKTSSLVKLASHLVIKEHKSVAILTTDTRKVGAVDQLRIYAQILNIPFGIIRNKEQWIDYLTSIKNVEYVLVDYPGLSLKTMEEIDELRSLIPPQGVPRTCHYVQAVTQKDSDAMELARRYKLTGFDDVIFTKLDESVSHGLIFNFQKEFDSPLHSFGVGPMLPEDFEPATRERVVDLIFKISKNKGS